MISGASLPTFRFRKMFSSRSASFLMAASSLPSSAACARYLSASAVSFSASASSRVRSVRDAMVWPRASAAAALTRGLASFFSRTSLSIFSPVGL